MNIKRWLADGCFCEILGRPLKGDKTERITKNRIRSSKERCGAWILGSEVLAHTNSLGPLAGKNESCFFHK